LSIKGPRRNVNNADFRDEDSAYADGRIGPSGPDRAIRLNRKSPPLCGGDFLYRFYPLRVPL
jgi:hypothetical protein